MLRDSVYFTTLKSLDYNVVMTFRFNNNNNNIIVLCFTRSDVHIVVDVLLPNVDASNGVFIAARMDQGGCTTFLAQGVFFYVLFGDNQVIIAKDLGKTSYIIINILKITQIVHFSKMLVQTTVIDLRSL